MCVITIRRVGLEDLREVVGAIDRSEHVYGEYTVVEGRFVERPVAMSDIPPLDPVGDGFHSAAAKAQFCASVVAPSFELPLAWFAYLDVNRVDRRHGVASALWDAAGHLARERDARKLYVSATPAASAVGFYLSRRCRLADLVHPMLFEHEPDDIHLVGEFVEPPAQIDGSRTRRLTLDRPRKLRTIDVRHRADVPVGDAREREHSRVRREIPRASVPIRVAAPTSALPRFYLRSVARRGETTARMARAKCLVGGGV